MSGTGNSSLQKSKLIVEKYHPGVRLLVSGEESFVFTDDVSVYKISHNDCSYYEPKSAERTRVIDISPCTMG